jgi:hypothetical protein
MGEGDDQSHWNYWRRELLVYQSGLLDGLPQGLVAPCCFGSAELPGSVICLWLEDLGEPDPAGWSLERYALAARHLGRLNGRFASALPPFPWYSDHCVRQWAASDMWKDASWEHPAVSRSLPSLNRQPAAQHASGKGEVPGGA